MVNQLEPPHRVVSTCLHPLLRPLPVPRLTLAQHDTRLFRCCSGSASCLLHRQPCNLDTFADTRTAVVRTDDNYPVCVNDREYRMVYNTSLLAPQQPPPLPLISARRVSAASGGLSSPSAVAGPQPPSGPPRNTTAAMGCGGATAAGSDSRPGQSRSARRRRNRLRLGAAGERHGWCTAASAVGLCPAGGRAVSNRSLTGQCLLQLSIASAMLAGPQPDATSQQRSAQLALAAELEERKLSKARQIGQTGDSWSAIRCL